MSAFVTLTPQPSRRALTRAALVGTGAAAGAVAMSAARARPAAAATNYGPVNYASTRVSSPAERHLLNRFTYGWTPALRAEVAAAGGIGSWWAKQLAMTRVDDTFYTTSAGWWASINASKDTLWSRHVDEVEPMWVAASNYQRWAMVRKVHSKRQVQEVVSEFWEHHFNVPTNGDPSMLWRSHYGKGIRARALGKFSDLLNFAIVHPAMQTYLTNLNSTASKPNENLARELLELHTVGRGNFTETDVKNAALLLTGWNVDSWRTWTITYAPGAHHVGTVKVLGFTDANTDTDGRAAVTRLLAYLAKHPATAKRVCRRIAQRFVSDSPSDALVDSLAQTYLANDTSITAVLNALIASAEFKASAGKKVRTPSEDVIATYRALGVVIKKPTQETSAANAILWSAEAVGLQPYSWPRPDGRPDNGEAYSSVSRILASCELHWGMAGGWWPTFDVTYRRYSSWVPEADMRFDYLVDHLSRTLTGRGSTAVLLRACCEAVGAGPSTVIGASHPLRGWQIPALLTVFLDQPAHMTR